MGIGYCFQECLNRRTFAPSCRCTLWPVSSLLAPSVLVPLVAAFLASVPVWVRLDHNRVTDVEGCLRELAEQAQLRYCLARDCTPTKCSHGAQACQSRSLMRGVVFQTPLRGPSLDEWRSFGHFLPDQDVAVLSGALVEGPQCE